MAKKWGKRKKAKSPIVMPGMGGDGAPFGPPHPSRQARPASTTPLADYLDRGHPGVDAGYVVLPRSLAEGMPLPWQQQLTALLTQFHDAHTGVSWPAYRVVPSRQERLVDLDEEQLAEAGYLVEIDADGEMVYRERSGRKVADPGNTVVLVPCLDPIVHRDGTAGDTGAGAASGVPGRAAEGGTQGMVPAQSRPEHAGGGGAAPGRGTRAEPAPMNIGPQPVWQSTPPAGGAGAPPLPPPPTAASVSAPPASPQAPPPEAALPTPPPAPSAASSTPPMTPPAAPVDPSAPGPSTPVAAWAPVPTPTEPTASGAIPGAASGTGARDWFDELPRPDDPGDVPEAAPETDPGSGGGFGPTGDEPTEIPYRYRR